MACENLSFLNLRNNLQSLEGYRKALLTKQISDHKRLLCAIGQYLLETRPSQIDGSYIVNIEALLNDLSQQANSWNWPPIDEIDSAVGIVGTLTEIVSNTDDSRRHRDPEFGKYAKQLGRKLKHIGGS